MQYPLAIFHIFIAYWFYGMADPKRLGHMAAVGDIPSVFSGFHGGVDPHRIKRFLCALIDFCSGKKGIKGFK